MRRLILTNKGFTLVELMVAVAISLVVLLAAGFMFSTTLKSSHANLRSVTLEQDLNTISEIMASELRRAGYWDDAMNNDPLANATVSGAAAPYNTYVHLSLPSATCATYYYDANSDHTVDNNELRAFQLNGTDLQMRRSCSSGFATCMGSCQVGDWETVNEESLVEITALSFSSTGSRCVNLSADADRYFDFWTVTNAAATDFRCPCTNDTDIANGYCDHDPGAAATGNCPANFSAGSCASTPPQTGDRLVSSRQVNFTIAARSEEDTAITKTISTSVKIANDHWMRLP